MQIIAILFGGLGIYKCFKNLPDKSITLLAVIHFLSLWGIYSALAFDYHENVIAAMLVPWFIYHFKNQKWLLASIYFCLILISKENMALWAIFIALGIGLEKFKHRPSLIVAVSLSCIALLYFILAIKVIMPQFSDTVINYNHLKYNYQSLGSSFPEAIHTILSKPSYVFKLMFTNHINDIGSDGIKAELFITILLSGGIALIFKPQYLFMLIPIFAQKLLSDDIVKWGITSHYSIEFVPILTLAVFSSIKNINMRYQKYIALVIVMSTVGISYAKLENRKSKWFTAERHQFYKSIHYKRHFDVDELHSILKTIPKNAIVSAHSPIVPHIAFRDKIYLFPKIDDAEYIVILEDEYAYPMSTEEFINKAKSLINSPEWELIYNQNKTLLFKRI